MWKSNQVSPYKLSRYDKVITKRGNMDPSVQKKIDSSENNRSSRQNLLYNLTVIDGIKFNISGLKYQSYRNSSKFLNLFVSPGLCLKPGRTCSAPNLPLNLDPCHGGDSERELISGFNPDLREFC